MAHFSRLAVMAFLFTATLLAYRFLARRRARQALMQQHGCRDPPMYPHTDRIWCYDLVRVRQDAIKKGRLLKLYEEQFASYGKTWEENFIGSRVINTMQTENVQQICTTLMGSFDRSPAGRSVAWPFLGKSLTSTDGADWKYSRNLVKPTFARSELSDINGLSCHVDKLIDLIPRDGSTFDIQPVLHKMFLDISTEFLFGKSMGALDPGAPFDSNQFLTSLDRALSGVAQRRLAGWLKPIRFAFDQDWKQAYKKVHSYLDERVKFALEATTADFVEKPDQGPERPLKKYVLLHEMAKQIRDPIELRYQILGVFIPGRDTTSILVSNVLFQLARNPHIWTKLREAATALRDDTDSLTFESLKSLADFRNVIFETLRLQGPGGRGVRTANQDVVIPRGGGENGQYPVLVTAGTAVHMNMWAMHHDSDIWGPDVQEFKPDRWIGKRPLWEFVPFSGGARICPANQQVMTHASYTLVRLTKEFRYIENRDPVLEYVELTKMTTQSRNGVKIALQREQ